MFLSDSVDKRKAEVENEHKQDEEDTGAVSTTIVLGTLQVHGVIRSLVFENELVELLSPHLMRIIGPFEENVDWRPAVEVEDQVVALQRFSV